MEGAGESWPVDVVSSDPSAESGFLNEDMLKEIEEEDAEELELSLGLSMNGRFGVDPSRKKLRRSSSVTNVESREACEGYAPLTRTCSLPTETEEWRRRKEWQSIKCMEARRKRMQKLKNVRLHGDGERSDERNLVQSSEGSNGSKSHSPGGASDTPSQLSKEEKQNPAMKSSSSLQLPPEQAPESPAVGAAAPARSDSPAVKATAPTPACSGNPVVKAAARASARPRSNSPTPPFKAGARARPRPRSNSPAIKAVALACSGSPAVKVAGRARARSNSPAVKVAAPAHSGSPAVKAAAPAVATAAHSYSPDVISAIRAANSVAVRAAAPSRIDSTAVTVAAPARSEITAVTVAAPARNDNPAVTIAAPAPACSGSHAVTTAAHSNGHTLMSATHIDGKTIVTIPHPKEQLNDALLDMPYVSTKGNGEDFNKIEGFLYRYKRGEEVKIVCVCHGLFLSPAEFVKHGGGGDVAQPLKHIVVNPYPLF